MKDVTIATSEKTDIKGPIRAADPSALPALSRKAYVMYGRRGSMT